MEGAAVPALSYLSVYRAFMTKRTDRNILLQAYEDSVRGFEKHPAFYGNSAGNQEDFVVGLE